MSLGKNINFKNLGQFLTDEQLVALLMASGDATQDALERMDDKGPEYPKDPVKFCDKILGVRLWEKQVEIAKSVIKNRNTIVEASKGVGKSYLCAALTCWWMTIHPDGKVVTLAPSAAHVNNVIWQDIRGLGRKAKLPGVILDTPKWKFSDSQDEDANKIAVGLSTHKASDKDVTSLQGYHSQHLLVIMDEAAGMGNVIWKAARGLPTSPKNRLVAIGNPIMNAGPFWNACQSKNWNYIHISALESPNVVAKEEIVPGLTSYEWVIETMDDHCQLTDPYTPRAFEFEGNWYMPDSYFEAQVLGIAPWETEDQTIARQWIKTAYIIELDTSEDEVVLGCDPSRGGDDPALIARRGLDVLWVKRKQIVSKNPSREVAQWCFDECNRMGATMVYIEAPGIGAGVVDYARELGVPVIEVYPSAAPNEKLRFANLRSEYYWTVRDLLKQEKMHLPEDDKLEADLTAQRHEYDGISRIKMMSKDKIKEKLGRSPDASDALAITFAYGVNANSSNVGFQAIKETMSADGSRWYNEKKTTTDQRGGSKWRKFTAR